jgi:hypothetical protein
MQIIQHLLFISLLTVVSGVYGDENSTKLSNAVKSARVSLETGLRASEREGKPISGKYELEDGKLQLSIYTMKASKFYEVIVDHTTGKIAKTAEITSGGDLAAAKEQSAAMAHAKESLRNAVKAAQKAQKGFRAISVTPSLSGSHPIAMVTLGKEAETRTVVEKLD